MKPYSRADRVSNEIKKAVSGILQTSIKDPRLTDVIITAVRMTRDLKIARIYFVSSGSKTNQKDMIEGFNKARGFLKRALSQEIELRYMPDLQFYYDESFDYGDNIEKLLKSIKTEYGSDNISLEK